MKHTSANYIKLSPGGPMWIRETAKQLLAYLSKNRKTLDLIKTDGHKITLYDQNLKTHEFTLQDLQNMVSKDLAKYLKGKDDLEMIVQVIASAMERGFDMQSFPEKSGNKLSYAFAPQEDEWTPMIKGEIGMNKESLITRVSGLRVQLNEKESPAVLQKKYKKTYDGYDKEAVEKAFQEFASLYNEDPRRYPEARDDQLTVMRQGKNVVMYLQKSPGEMGALNKGDGLWMSGPIFKYKNSRDADAAYKDMDYRKYWYSNYFKG
jgi:hypothetical protein